MISKLAFCLPLRRNPFLKTPTHLRFSLSTLAESNVSNSNTPSQNLFVHFVTTRFNMSSAHAAKMVKRLPSLGRLKTLDKVEQLLCMLNRHGCSDDQIANIIKSHPLLLLASSERVLEPKIQLLKDFCVERENMVEFLKRCPSILTFKLETLRCRLELLKTVFPKRDFLFKAIMRNHNVLENQIQKTLESSVAFWEGFGIRGTELTKFLLFNPRVLTRCTLTPAQLDLIGKIGILKGKKTYKYVVSMVANCRIEALEAKIDKLRLCGLSPAQAWEVVRVCPSVLLLSKENIKKKMDFMLNHMELSVDFVAKHSRMFSMSLDKVMRPRFLVIQTMTAMNGAGEVNPTRLCIMLMMTEAKFVAQIIQGHPESAALWTVYRNAIANVSERSKISVS
ncbi:hypothetical protein SUGI_0204420 [Cryptomeria japonica]|uniref:uncharacterized protein LOC131050929 n=1 Tax=Cryptomeria japonica TaxID=3369 RepID=UPI002408E0A8|nr:uncharacterized protein LOC131050929 [Cryptomeria japonica]GLJ13063.1 hypothetical protein SUGI_0204420 [Cryptomeria japonica]